MTISESEAIQLISDPLHHVDSLFAQQTIHDPPARAPESWGEADRFEELVQRHWDLIPSLQDPHVNVCELRTNCLVRYRCMIQDIFDPEYYASSYLITNEATGVSERRTTKYRESIPDAPSGFTVQFVGGDQPTDICERGRFFAVPVPAQCEWVSKEVTQTEPHLPQEEEMHHVGDGNGYHNGTNEARTRGYLLNYPIPWEEKEPTDPLVVSPIACLLKVYGLGESDGDQKIKLNEIVEAVGALSNHRLVAPSPGGEAEDDPSEDWMRHVPRIHVLYLRRLGNFNPLKIAVQPGLCLSLPQVRPSASDWASLVSSGSLESISNIRSALIDWLSTCTGGDRLSAEYVMLAALGCSFKTGKGEEVIGRVNLNLFGFTSGTLSPQPLISILKQILPRVAEIPLSVERLNKSSFAPKKDPALNRLVSGLLQLPTGTFLALDESNMAEGTLDANGLKNLQDLIHLVSRGEVEYDFVMYTLPFPTDVSVMAFSDAPSLITSFSERLPIQMAADAKLQEAPPSAAVLRQIREYVSLCTASDISLELSKEMQEKCESAYVQARREIKNLDERAFSTWMALARLISISHGTLALTESHWDSLMRMEAQRRERLQQRGRAAPKTS